MISLRHTLRRERRKLPFASRSAFDFNINQALLNSGLLLRSPHIAGYLANDGEPSISLFINTCFERNITHYLPVIHKKTLHFSAYASGDSLKNNIFNIPEPETRLLIPSKFLSVVLLPLVAYDNQGNRLGMGGGYYDCSLRFLLNSNCKKRPLLIGIAYSLQCVKHIERQPWDIALDAVVTENGLECFTTRAKQLLNFLC
ncbi:MAG: 5-formyltetrahydrofolate cyclo-ligase [Cycloclasticus sp.]|nr:MAG: 5-formyltetrahydrofolate cyclo-ligase [Cycloclasticus sp.]